MSKIRDLIELRYFLGGGSRKVYASIMQGKRYLPKDRESIKRELERSKANVEKRQSYSEPE